jgi:hypothetical protein
MSGMVRFLLWLVLAWPTPALIAGALGWKGIWGSGSALADYLIPIPVAGGVFHAMTFGVVTAILLTQPWRALFAALVRPVLLAIAVVGGWLLWDFERGRLSENPVGLFLLTDALIAQLFVGAFGGRSPAGGKEWGVALVTALALPAAAIATLHFKDPRTGQVFTYAGSRPGQQPGDASHFVFSRKAASDPAFKPEAAAYAETWHPRYNINEEDIAIYFFTDKGAAQFQDERSAVMTYCMYQDGTPPFWESGKGDCFSGHQTVRERYERTGSREKACEGVKVPVESNFISSLCKPR